MTFHLGHHVISGFIDNTVRGKITGQLIIDGILEPIMLDLNGNAFADIAGCVVHFENHHSVPISEEVGEMLLSTQKGNAGKFTASRRMALDCEEPNVDFPYEPGIDDPGYFTLMNVIELVWYDSRICRVILRAVGYEISAGLPKWKITAGEVEKQLHDAAAAEDVFRTLSYDAMEEEESLEEGGIFDLEDEDDEDIPF
ncbi:MAG: hypothetical protein P1V20_27880 [Verrucomicrobiales bacterium]|nr:hypothetical protein [Verrucomicrobiales bacterium]